MAHPHRGAIDGFQPESNYSGERSRCGMRLRSRAEGGNQPGARKRNSETSARRPAFLWRTALLTRGSARGAPCCQIRAAPGGEWRLRLHPHQGASPFVRNGATLAAVR